MDYSWLGSFVHGDFPGKNTGVGFHDLPNLGIKPRSPELQADSLLSEPPEKPFCYFIINNKRITILVF